MSKTDRNTAALMKLTFWYREVYKMGIARNISVRIK